MAAGIGLLCVLGLSCREKREDPLVTMANKYSGGAYVDFSSYYQKATGVKLGLKGIVISVDQGGVDALMSAITSDYLTALPFRIEKNYGEGGRKDKVAVVTAIDQFELVKEMQTQGKEDKVGNAAIVKGLKALNSKVKIKINGVGIDYVEFAFREDPKDWAEIAADCAALAPNIVTYGTGNVGKLASELEEFKRAVLWWN
jgi:hypothetical protein